MDPEMLQEAYVLELTAAGAEMSRAYVEAGGDVIVNDAALEGSRLEMGGSVGGVAARMRMTLGAPTAR